jgi:biopolymer transport protein ExbB/TolQ
VAFFGKHIRTGGTMSFNPEIEAVLQACGRTARVVHRKMGRGRASLAAIASTAAPVGILGTMIGIMGSFKGCPGGSDAEFAGAIARSFAEAMVPTAWGLPIAIFAVWGHNYLCRQQELIDTETYAASIELANLLGRTTAT